MNKIDDLISLILEAVKENEACPVSTEPRRLFHGRGHHIPGGESINIDFLPPVALITLYREWEPSALETLAASLGQILSSSPMTIVLQRRYLKPAVFEPLVGEMPDSLVVSEAELNYRLYFRSGMHTGLFLDMAAARQWLRHQVAGRRVLNLFAYSCAFSVVAIAGGAQRVVNIDMSSNALSKGRENHRLNHQKLDNVDFLAHDIFKSWGRLKRCGPFDCLIIDPPSYQPGSFIAGKDYARIIRRLPALLTDGADVLICSNDPTKDTRFLRSTVAEQAKGFVYQARLENPAGFSDSDPERALKVLHYKYFDQVD